VGMVTTNENTIDVEPMNVSESCPCRSKGHFCQLMRAKVVSTLVFLLESCIVGTVGIVLDNYNRGRG